MGQYIIRRLLLSVVVVWMVASFVFFLMRVLPGDVLTQELVEAERLDPAVLKRLRASLGLDKPVWEQYLIYMKSLAQGDLGKSMKTAEPIWTIFRRVFPVTAQVAFSGLFLAVIIAIPIGVLSAIRRNTPADYIGRVIAIAGISVPEFWLGTLVLTFPAIWWGYAPPIGYDRVWVKPFTNLQQVYLPILILGFRLSASNMRMTRSTMLEVLREDYIRTAWAKGLRERVVIFRHALKNALIPVITITGNQFAFLLGGTVILEVLFFLPGMGRTTYQGILDRDYTLVQGQVTMFALLLVTINLLVDISYAWFDPRIRYR